MMSNKKRNYGRIRLIGIGIAVLGLVFAGYLGFGDKNQSVIAQSQEGTGIIYDNGGLSTGATSNSGVAAPAGTTWSEAQNETGNTTFSNTLAGVGCGVATTGTFRCADNFVVPAGQTWTVSSVVVFAYQTGFAGATSPITAGTLQIWNGRPGDAGSTVIFGDTATNRLGASTDSLFYRIFNSSVPAPGSAPGTTRRIWRNSLTVSPGLVLGAGNYWIDWATQVGVNTTHFAPPITIPGIRTQAGWNARQFNPVAPAAWQDVIDVGNPDASAPDVPLDYPFKLTGSIASATPQRPQVDFDGDGRSDYSSVRNNTPPFSGLVNPVAGRRSIQELQNDPGFKPLEPAGNGVAPSTHGTNLGWYIRNSMSNTARVQGHGVPATDFWVPEDYDGDGRDDIAVWRGVAASGPNGGHFYTFTSSDNTVNQIDFGVLGDNPLVVGDYDGDLKADPAVYRCPQGGGQCTFYYRGSLNNPSGNITFAAWGNNSGSGNAIRPYPGDFDGDGKNDFSIFQNGTYITRRSSNNSVEYVNWGLTTDPVLAPGDYDGDGKTDFMNVRVNGVNVEWWLRRQSGQQSTTTWGALVPGFAEFITPADFDGDGKTDISIWRRSNTGTTGSLFYTLRSSNGMLESLAWGIPGDAPVPGWNAQ